MINIKIEHRGTGLAVLDHDHVVNESLFIYDTGEFEYDGGNPKLIIYKPYVKDNITPYITMHGDFTPSTGVLYTTNNGEELNIVFNVNYDGYTPPPSGDDDTGDKETGDKETENKDEPLDGDYAVDSNGAILRASLNPFKLVIHYKDLEGKTVLYDTDYDNVFWVRRYDEGDYINLEIANGEDSEEPISGTSVAYYKITDRVQIRNTILNPPLILKSFDGFGGLLDESNDVFYYEGKSDYTVTYEGTAYYEPNSFDISIFINDSSRGKVVSTSDTSTNYPSGSTISGVHKNYTLKLTAVPIAPYVFDYLEVNGEKKYNSNLNYEVTTNTTVNCYFKEPIIPEDDRIATNDYINSLFGDETIYEINNDENSPYYEFKCPTKWDIKNAGIDKSRPAEIIQISNTYDDNQCVKEEDISILDKEIKLEFENENVPSLALSIITIYASADTLPGISSDDVALFDWRIEKGSGHGWTDSTSFKIPKNLTGVYNKKLKLRVIGYYGTNRHLKLYTNVNDSYVDRNSSGAVVISGSVGGYPNIISYGFKFNIFLNSSINPPKIKIVISA